MSAGVAVATFEQAFPTVPERQVVHSNEPSEQALVVLCARTDLSDRQVTAIRRQIRRGVDWSSVAQYATSHGVQPLVYHTLKQHCDDLMPGAVRRQIERYERGATLRNSFIVDELQRVLNRLEREGIPALPLKGPVLARVAYGDVHHRWYTDLDVLIPSWAFPQVEHLLLENDYVPFEKVKVLHGIKRRIYYYLSGQWPFKRGNGVFNLDVHVQLMPPGYHYPVAFDEFWERSQPLVLGDSTIHRFAAEDMLQILCFHGAKNQWSALKHVCDVAELIRAKPSMNWAAVVERARAIRGVHVLSLGLLLAERVLEASVPANVLRQLAPPAAVEAMADRLAERLTREARSTAFSYEERVQLQLLLQDTWPKKARYTLYSFARNVWDKWIK